MFKENFNISHRLFVIKILKCLTHLRTSLRKKEGETQRRVGRKGKRRRGRGGKRRSRQKDG